MNPNVETTVLFSLQDLLESYDDENEVVKELREKLSGVERHYEYDMETDEKFSEREAEALAKEFGLSEKASLCLAIDMSFFVVKKTGENLMGEMNKLCMGMEKFKNAVESGRDVESVVAEVVKECGLEDC